MCLFRTAAEQTASRMEHEKEMTELELKESSQRHKSDIGKKDLQIANVSATITFLSHVMRAA